MSATNKTTHYELPVFLGSDKPAWLVDWNGAMVDIDSAIYEAKTTADGAAAGVTTVSADLATLSGTVTTQGTSISTLSGSLTSLIGTVNTITSLIGNGEPTTTDKTIIGAINELNAKIPEPQPVIATDFVEFKRQFSNKKIVVIGDSLSVDNTTWVKSLNDLCDTCGSTVTNISVAGRRSGTMLPDVQALETAYDVAILWIGTNDAASGSPTPIGSLSTAGSYIKNMYDMLDALITLNDDMKIFVLGLPYSSTATLNKDKSFYDYSFAAKQVANYCGAVFKNMGHLVCSGPHNHSAQPVDGLHFSEVFSKTELFTTIVNKMLVPSSDEVHEVIKLKPQDLTFSGGVSAVYLTGYYVVGGHVHVEATLNFANEVAVSTDFITFPAPIRAVDEMTFIMSSGQNVRYCFVHENGVKPVSTAIGAGESWRVTLDFPVATGMLEQYANA